ncbi:Small VCP/p97-interacting protein [Microtus ochrogaster]|uniref:Small VCP/p97-interacting protein n=1 Tax=Microtus ochrogaster TaxID=79684 RepID=A0A8J6G061_MICOH|nr:Small VCP/p97-interacting protein [Microtus ochrogaster]
MGLCFPCPLESTLPSPSPEEKKKAKLAEAAERRQKEASSSGDLGYPISGGKEEEERTVRKADGNFGTTSRLIQVCGVMKHHTVQECCATNSSICSQMDFS